MNKTKLLVVDDDLRLRELLKRYLSEQSYVVDTVPDGAAMDRSLARERYDLMVLDLMMPNEDGLAICRRLRAKGEMMPIIMLTAKGDEVDRIVGLEMGARLSAQAVQSARAGGAHPGCVAPAGARLAAGRAGRQRRGH